MFVAYWPARLGNTLIHPENWAAVNARSHSCFYHPTKVAVPRGTVAVWVTPSVVHAGSGYERPNSRLYMALDSQCVNFFKSYRLDAVEDFNTKSDQQ